MVFRLRRGVRAAPFGTRQTISLILIFCDGGFANRVNSMVSGEVVPVPRTVG